MIPKPLTGSALKNRQNRKRSFLIWQCYCSMPLLFNQKTLRPRPHVSVFLWKRISPPPQFDPPSTRIWWRGHWKRIFSKTLSRAKIFENVGFSFKSRLTKTEVFKYDDVIYHILWLNFFKHFWGGRRDLIEKGGLFKLFSETHQREQGFSRTELWFPGVILLFLIIGKW